jgi:hypothetical protein
MAQEVLVDDQELTCRARWLVRTTNPHAILEFLESEERMSNTSSRLYKPMSLAALCFDDVVYLT